jgi:hypothetical protein
MWSLIKKTSALPTAAATNPNPISRLAAKS